MYLCTPQKNGCLPEIKLKKQPQIALIILNNNNLKFQLVTDHIPLQQGLRL